MRMISYIAALLSGLSLVILMGMTNIGVLYRYVLNSPIRWGEEASGILLACIIALGLIVAENKNTHLSISVLPDSLANKFGDLINVFSCFIDLFVVLIMSYLAFNFAVENTQVTNLLRIKYSYVVYLFSFSFFGVAIFTLKRMKTTISQLNNSREA